MGGAVSSGRDNAELIDNLMGGNYIRSRDVERVFRALDRGDYMTPEAREQAYKDLAWRNGPLHMSAPCIYSEVMEGLELRPGLSFLNIGSGTGYLSTLVGLILGSGGINHGVEVHPVVLDYANRKLSYFLEHSMTLDEFDFCEPRFYAGNGLCLAPLQTPYDRVYCGAGCPEEYQSYFQQLIKVGGILVMPLNDNLLQVRRTGPTEWHTRSLLNVSFATLRVPSRDEARELIRLEEQIPARLQALSRAAIRATMRAALRRRHPALREPPPRAPPAKKACPRRICIPVEDESDNADLNALHDLDRASGANEMNALLNLVLSMGHSRVAGALRVDPLDSDSSSSYAPDERDERDERDEPDLLPMPSPELRLLNVDDEIGNDRGVHTDGNGHGRNRSVLLFEFRERYRARLARARPPPAAHTAPPAPPADRDEHTVDDTRVAHDEEGSSLDKNNSEKHTTENTDDKDNTHETQHLESNEEILKDTNAIETKESASNDNANVEDKEANLETKSTKNDTDAKLKPSSSKSSLNGKDDATDIPTTSKSRHRDCRENKDRKNRRKCSKNSRRNSEKDGNSQVAAEVEVNLDKDEARPANMEWESSEPAEEHKSSEDDTTESTSKLKDDKRQKLDSGIGEENTPSSDTESHNTDSDDDDDSGSDSQDEGCDERRGRRRRQKRGHLSTRSSSSTDSSMERGRGRRRSQRRARLDSERRATLSALMRRAAADLPLPPPLQAYVNYHRAFRA